MSTLASRLGDVSRPSSPFAGPIEPITESDEEIRAYLEGAEVPPLLLSIRKDVHDRFNERVDAGNQARAWGQSGVRSWYKNEYGRVSQNWPFTLLEYWQRTLRPDPDDFELVS